MWVRVIPRARRGGHEDHRRDALRRSRPPSVRYPAVTGVTEALASAWRVGQLRPQGFGPAFDVGRQLATMGRASQERRPCIAGRFGRTLQTLLGAQQELAKRLHRGGAAGGQSSARAASRSWICWARSCASTAASSRSSRFTSGALFAANWAMSKVYKRKSGPLPAPRAQTDGGSGHHPRLHPRGPEREKPA